MNYQQPKRSLVHCSLASVKSMSITKKRNLIYDEGSPHSDASSPFVWLHLHLQFCTHTEITEIRTIRSMAQFSLPPTFDNYNQLSFSFNNKRPMVVQCLSYSVGTIVAFVGVKCDGLPISFFGFSLACVPRLFIFSGQWPAVVVALCDSLLVKMYRQQIETKSTLKLLAPAGSLFPLYKSGIRISFGFSIESSTSTKSIYRAILTAKKFLF